MEDTPVLESPRGASSRRIDDIMDSVTQVLAAQSLKQLLHTPTHTPHHSHIDRLETKADDLNDKDTHSDNKKEAVAISPQDIIDLSATHDHHTSHTYHNNNATAYKPQRVRTAGKTTKAHKSSKAARPSKPASSDVSYLQQLSEDDCVCCVCVNGESSEDNAIVFCDGQCQLAYHQLCVGLAYLPADNWYCCNECRDGTADLQVLTKNVESLRKQHSQRRTHDRLTAAARRRIARELSRSSRRSNTRAASQTRANVANVDAEVEHVRRLWLKVLPYYIPPTAHEISMYTTFGASKDRYKLPPVGQHYIDRWQTEDTQLGIRARSYKRHTHTAEPLSSSDSDDGVVVTTEQRAKKRSSRDMLNSNYLNRGDQAKHVLHKRVLKAARKAARHHITVNFTATLTEQQLDDINEIDIGMSDTEDNDVDDADDNQSAAVVEEINIDKVSSSESGGSDTEELADAIEPTASPYFTLRAQDIGACFAEGTMDNRRLRAMITYVAQQQGYSSPVKRIASHNHNVVDNSVEQPSGTDPPLTPTASQSPTASSHADAEAVVSGSPEKQITDALNTLPKMILTSAFYSGHYVPPIQLYNTNDQSLHDMHYTSHRLSFEVDKVEHVRSVADVFEKPRQEDVCNLDEVTCEFWLLHKELDLQLQYNNTVKQQLTDRTRQFKSDAIMHREQWNKSAVFKYEQLMKLERGTLACNLHSTISGEPYAAESAQARRKRERRERRNNGESDVSSSSDDDDSDDDSVQNTVGPGRSQQQRHTKKWEKQQRRLERDIERTVKQALSDVVDAVVQKEREEERQEKMRQKQAQYELQQQKRSQARAQIAAKKDAELLRLCNNALQTIVSKLEKEFEPHIVKQRAKERRRQRKLAKLQAAGIDVSTLDDSLSAGSMTDHDESDADQEESVALEYTHDPSKKYDGSNDEIVCQCGIPVDPDEEFFIQCEACDKWYHGDCCGVNARMAPAIVTYYCLTCQLETGVQPVLKAEDDDDYAAVHQQSAMKSKPGKNGKLLNHTDEEADDEEAKSARHILQRFDVSCRCRVKRLTSFKVVAHKETQRTRTATYHLLGSFDETVCWLTNIPSKRVAALRHRDELKQKRLLQTRGDGYKTKPESAVTVIRGSEHDRDNEMLSAAIGDTAVCPVCQTVKPNNQTWFEHLTRDARVARLTEEHVAQYLPENATLLSEINKSKTNLQCQFCVERHRPHTFMKHLYRHARIGDITAEQGEQVAPDDKQMQQCIRDGQRARDMGVALSAINQCPVCSVTQPATHLYAHIQHHARRAEITADQIRAVLPNANALLRMVEESTGLTCVVCNVEVKPTDIYAHLKVHAANCELKADQAYTALPKHLSHLGSKLLHTLEAAMAAKRPHTRHSQPAVAAEPAKRSAKPTANAIDTSNIVERKSARRVSMPAATVKSESAAPKPPRQVQQFEPTAQYGVCVCCMDFFANRTELTQHVSQHHINTNEITLAQMQAMFGRPGWLYDRVYKKYLNNPHLPQHAEAIALQQEEQAVEQARLDAIAAEERRVAAEQEAVAAEAAKVAAAAAKAAAKAVSKAVSKPQPPATKPDKSVVFKLDTEVVLRHSPPARKHKSTSLKRKQASHYAYIVEPVVPVETVLPEKRSRRSSKPDTAVQVDTLPETSVNGITEASEGGKVIKSARSVRRKLTTSEPSAEDFNLMDYGDAELQAAQILSSSGEPTAYDASYTIRRSGRTAHIPPEFTDEDQFQLTM